MHARRGKADHCVARRDIFARQQRVARNRADGEAGQVVIAVLINAGHFRGFAADERATGFPAPRGDARDDRRANLGIELAASKIVEKEQGFGALNHEVVYRHGDEIDANCVVAGGLDRDLDLGANAVGRRDEDCIRETSRFEIEQAAEAADFGVRARTGGPAQQRLDQFHHAVAGIDVDTGGRVASLFHGFTNSRMTLPRRAGLLGASYVGIGGCASARRPAISGPEADVRERAGAGARLSIPNLVTLGRIMLVPIVVWAIMSGEMRAAFFLFLAAGISDAVDGFIAKRFHMASELGALLDPLADKALIVSIYVALGIAGALPISLVILVVSRDIMIISGFMLSWLVGKPMPVRPLPVSKLNTVAQIVLATLVLAEQSFRLRCRSCLEDSHRAGRHLDVALDRLLSRRVAPPHELGRSRALASFVRVGHAG